MCVCVYLSGTRSEYLEEGERSYSDHSIDVEGNLHYQADDIVIIQGWWLPLGAVVKTTRLCEDSSAYTE